jgi:hypothetical protein
VARSATQSPDSRLYGFDHRLGVRQAGDPHAVAHGHDIGSTPLSLQLAAHGGNDEVVIRSNDHFMPQAMGPGNDPGQGPWWRLQQRRSRFHPVDLAPSGTPGMSRM